MLVNLSYTLSVSKDGVVAVWFFDERSGNVTKDPSGNRNDAKKPRKVLLGPMVNSAKP